MKENPCESRLRACSKKIRKGKIHSISQLLKKRKKNVLKLLGMLRSTAQKKIKKAKLSTKDSSMRKKMIKFRHPEHCSSSPESSLKTEVIYYKKSVYATKRNF
jgi:hypothetical protein